MKIFNGNFELEFVRRRLNMIVFGLAITVFSIAGCADSGLDVQDQADSTVSDEVEALLKDQASSEQLAVEPVDGIALVMLDWAALKPPMREEDMDRSRVIALGFSESTLLEPPFDAETVSMGDVVVRDSDQQEYSLREHINPMDDIAYIYGMGPRQRGERADAIPYRAGAEDQIHISGSDAFGAVDFAVQAPSNRINVVDEPGLDVISRGEDLTIKWNNQDTNEPVAIRIMPAKRPQHRPGEGEPPARPKKTEPIIVDAGTQQYTISADEITQMLDDKDADGVMVHVGQLFVTDINAESGLIRVITRLNDGKVVRVED